MKCYTVLFFVIMSMISARAQHLVLYGTTTSGNGGIFRYSEENNELKNVYRFKNSGVFSKSQMILAKNGIIYGVAEGGPYGNGIIYSLDPVTNKYTIEKNFTLDNIGASQRPTSALVQGKDDKLYGTTRDVLYSFDPVTSVYREIFRFADGDVNNPQAVTIASDGRLYGIASLNDT